MGRGTACPELRHRCIARGVLAVAVLAGSIIIAAVISMGQAVEAGKGGGNATSLDTLAHCLSCRDKPTPDGFPCELQARWGKCQDPWMVAADYCSLTCSRCCLGAGLAKLASSGPPPARGKYDANVNSDGDMIVVLHGAGGSKIKATKSMPNAEPSSLKAPPLPPPPPPESSPASWPAVLPTADPEPAPDPAPTKHESSLTTSPASEAVTERMLQQPLSQSAAIDPPSPPALQKQASPPGPRIKDKGGNTTAGHKRHNATSPTPNLPSPVGDSSAAVAAELEHVPLDQRYACDGHLNIHQVLQAQAQALRMGVFVEALHWAGLEDSFNQPNAQATVLIPVDAAWQRLASDLGTSVADLLSNTTALRAIILYHLVPQSLSPAALQRTPVIPTYWKGHDLYGTFSSDTLMLGAGSGRNAHILQKLQVCHSFLYTLDRVLLPTTQKLSSLPQLTEFNPNDRVNTSNTCTAPPTALAALKADADLSTTASALALLGLSDKLGASTSNLTLLAPTNAAWDIYAASLNISTSTLLRNTTLKDNLKSIMEFHLVPRSLTCGQSLCEGSYTSLNSRGGPLYVHNLSNNKSSMQSLTSSALVVPVPEGSCLGNNFLIRVDSVLQPGPNSAPRN